MRAYTLLLTLFGGCLAQNSAPSGGQEGQVGNPPPTGLDVPPCRGLSIGTSLHASNVVDDGYTLASWAFGRGGQEAVVVGGEVRV